MSQAASTARYIGEAEAQLAELEGFLLALGRALVVAGAPVNEIQERLLVVAGAYGAPQARILVFPTFLQVVVEPGKATMTELTRSSGGAFRLDQVAALYELLRGAEAGRVPIHEGSAVVAQVFAMRSQHQTAPDRQDGVTSDGDRRPVLRAHRKDLGDDCTTLVDRNPSRLRSA